MKTALKSIFIWGVLAVQPLAIAQEVPIEGAALVANGQDTAINNKTGLPIPRFVSLKTSEGNIRRGPSLTHRIDWVFSHKGTPLKITAEYEHWRLVSDAEGFGGWVHYSLLSGTRTVLVIADQVDARIIPSENAAIAFRADQGVIGRLLECNGLWCKIEAQGYKGWVPIASVWGVENGEVLD